MVKPGLNLSEFGSHWLLFNKISDRSIYQNVKRVVGGNSLFITLNHPFQIVETGFRWLPSLENSSWNTEEYHQSLRSLVSVTSSVRQKSLSLSGGMDSRVLLSLMYSDKKEKLHTHTFGEETEPDCLIAKQLSERLGFQNDHHNFQLQSTTDALAHIRGYTNLTQVNNRASAFLQFENYKALDGARYFLIDGGFGEIWRREFFVKLYLSGKSTIRSRNFNKLLPAIRLHRADIFTQDAISQMERGVESELHYLFDYLPDLSLVSFGDWLDIFAIKTRLLNYYANEQSVLDTILPGIMPFASVSLLNNLFSIPIAVRKNGRLFRSIIRTNKPELADFRLAKNSLTVPFSAGTLHTRLLKQTSKLFNKPTEKSQAATLLNLLKPFILDTLASGSFKEYPYYNTSAIKKMVEKFYQTGSEYADELDWWLAFEVFRQEYL